MVLGSGNRPLNAPNPNWIVINHDRDFYAKHVTEVWDLNRTPWPWGDGSISQVVAHSVLEHLSLSLVQSMNECWRILKPGGKLDLKLPVWNADRSWDDPTHLWFVGSHWLDNFDWSRPRGKTYAKLYGIMPWQIVSEEPPGADGVCLRGILQAVKPAPPWPYSKGLG